MLRFLLIFAILIFISRCEVYSQENGCTQYQAILHDNKGELIVNKNISQRFIVKDEKGKIYYQEVHIVSTDSSGLVRINFECSNRISEELYLLQMEHNANCGRIEIELGSSNSIIKIDGGQIFNAPYFPYSYTLQNESLAGSGCNYTLTLGKLFLIVPGINNYVYSVQERLLKGESPLHVYKSGIPVDSLYGKAWCGGLIFYLDTIDGTGLVCAPEDQAYGEWSCLGIPGHQSHLKTTGVGSLATINKSSDPSAFSPRISYTYKFGDYSDWFLPTKEELNLIHVNLRKKGIGSFSLVYYWSSTESGADVAWGQLFFDGSQVSLRKNYCFAVRLIREF